MSMDPKDYETIPIGSLEEYKSLKINSKLQIEKIIIDWVLKEKCWSFHPETKRYVEYQFQHYFTQFQCQSYQKADST